MDEVVEALEKYQGLVPLVYEIETMSLEEARPEEMQCAVYLKREADKVIAGLEESHKMEVEQLLMEIVEMKKACNSKDEWCLHTLKENRHHKYKRCLDKAEIASHNWHLHNSFYLMGHKDFELKKCDLYERHRNRWMELAEKFKDGK